MSRNHAFAAAALLFTVVSEVKAQARASEGTHSPTSSGLTELSALGDEYVRRPAFSKIRRGQQIAGLELGYGDTELDDQALPSFGGRGGGGPQGRPSNSDRSRGSGAGGSPVGSGGGPSETGGEDDDEGSFDTEEGAPESDDGSFDTDEESPDTDQGSSDIGEDESEAGNEASNAVNLPDLTDDFEEEPKSDGLEGTDSPGLEEIDVEANDSMSEESDDLADEGSEGDLIEPETPILISTEGDTIGDPGAFATPEDDEGY